jgi:hypothetical protein
MRVMVIVKATPESEAGKLPPPEVFQEMGRFNDELMKAGVMLAGEGLHPSSTGARITFSGDSKTVVDGPFAETKELIAGFWILQVKSLDEAVEWMKRSPFREGTIEIRRVFETEDFGDALPADVREAEDRMREQLADRR